MNLFRLSFLLFILKCSVGKEEVEAGENLLPGSMAIDADCFKSSFMVFLTTEPPFVISTSCVYWVVRVFFM